MTIKWATKDGFLTRYSHACGYLDVASVGGSDNEITMGLDGLYFVRARATVTRPKVWECFDGPTARKDARRFFLQLIRERNGVRKVNRNVGG